MIFISPLEIINIGLCEAKSKGRPDPNILLWIAASVAAAAAVSGNGIKTLLANGLSKFFNKGNPVFSNGPKSLPKNSPDCPVLCNWVFDICILADELFTKALKTLKLVY